MSRMLLLAWIFCVVTLCANAGYAEFKKLAAIEGFDFRYYGAFTVQ